MPGTSYAKLTITLFLSYFEYCFLSIEKKLTTHLTSVMRSQRKTDKSVPIWKLYLDIYACTLYNTHTMLQKQSFECTRVLIFKREKIRRLEYALFLLVLWRLGVKTGRHGDPRLPGHLGCSCIQFPKHYWWSLRFFIHFGLLKQPPAGQQKEKEQVFCVQLEHYRSCLKLLEHSIEAMTKMITYCPQSTPFQG